MSEARRKQRAQGFRPTAEDDLDVLKTYFADLAKADVMDPEAEAQAAANVASLEIGLWCAVLAAPVLHQPLIDVIRQSAPPQFNLSFLGSLSCDIGEVARQLRAVDDGRLLTAASDAAVALAPKLGARGKRYEREVREARAARDSARNDFVTANLRLVISIARKFNTGRLPLADLIQEGNLGLIRAVSRYDLERGFRFSTYASWWIRHAIGRALAEKGRSIRLPVEIISEQYRLRRVLDKLTGELGREPSDEELAATLKTDVERLRALRVWCREDHLRLDQPHPIFSNHNAGHDGHKLMSESIPDPGQELEAVAPEGEQAVLMETVRSLLPALKPIEQDILRHRFNLDGVGEQTLKEIGKRHDLSRERIRQLQVDALRKLRLALAKRGMA